MKALYTIATLFICLTCLSSCDKEGEEEVPGERIYYDYFSYNAANPMADNQISNKRVCYDITNKKVVWEKANTHIMPNRYWATAGGTFYSYSRSEENFLYRIFPATELALSHSSTTPYPIEGIYFQKVNKETGEETITKIIDGNELTPNSAFIISNVVYFDTGIYFACNNGNIYKYDFDGNRVWAKPAYHLADVGGGTGLAYGNLYGGFDFGLFFIAYETVTGFNHKNLIRLDFGGVEKWSSATVAEPSILPLMFGWGYVVSQDKLGEAYSYNIKTGVKQPSIHPGGTNNGEVARSIGGIGRVGQISGNMGAYFGVDNNIYYVDMANIQNKVKFDIGGLGSEMDNDFTAEDNKLWGASISTTNHAFSLSYLNIDPANPSIVYHKLFPYTNAVKLFGYRMSSGNIYVFCNFRINSSNQCELQPSGATLIKFNGYTGEITDQVSGLPLDDVNNVVSGMYNFAF